MKLRVVLLIRSLDTGGAQRQVLTLATALDRSRFEVTVVTYRAARGGLLPQPDGLRHMEIQKHGTWDATFPLRLAQGLRELRPHCIYAFLTMSNLWALACRPWLGRAKLISGVRVAGVTAQVPTSRLERALLWAERRLIRHSDLIISNSVGGKQTYSPAVPNPDRILVIPNGVDTERFQPRPEAGTRLRTEWGIERDAPLIGIVARLDSLIKDHETFLAAAARLPQHYRFAVVGDGEAHYRAWLHARAATLGLADRVLWLGDRRDMPEVYAAFNLATLSSKYEGFPNALAEAMACGVPCVGTDVGDTGHLLGTTGLVVPAGDAAGLAAAWQTVLQRPRAEAGEASRQRIVEHFSQHQLGVATAMAIERLIAEA